MCACVCVCVYACVCVRVFVRSYPSLEGTQAGGLDVHGLVGQPEPRGHVHDETQGVPVLDLCKPHAVHVPLRTVLQLLLQPQGKHTNTHHHGEAGLRERV